MGRNNDNDDAWEDDLPPEPELRRSTLPIVRGPVDGGNCAECPLAVNSRAPRPVPGEGAEDPAWIIVGEGPGSNEVAIGRPFVGAAGQLVNKMLTTIGVEREQLWITNATNCIPPHDATDIDKRKAQKCCAPRLLGELTKYPGKPILALGAVAAQAFLGTRFSITEMAGSYHEIVVGTPAMRDLADQLYDLSESLHKAQIKYDKANAKFEEAYQVHLEACADSDKTKWFDPKHKKKCKIAKKVCKLADANDDCAAAAINIEAERANVQVAFDALTATHHEVKRAIIPTIHPAAILRGGAGVGGAHAPDLAFWNLIYDAAKVKALAEGRAIKFNENDGDIEWQDATRADKLIANILVSVHKHGWCAVDCETYVEDEKRHSTLQPLHAKLRALGIATPDWGVSVYWPIVAETTKAAIATMLADPNIRKTFHNCLTGDSRVWLADGRRVRIEKLVRTKYRGKVYCFNEQTGQIETKRVIGWIKNGVRPYKDWRRIRVRGKGCLRLTCNHEVITTRGRVRADEIEIGDRIYTSAPELTDVQCALLYGTLLGDASIATPGLNRSPRLTVAHELLKQGDYARFKAAVLGDLVSSVSVVKNQRGFSAHKKNAKLLCVTTHADARLYVVQDVCRVAGHRHFTDAWVASMSDAALAIWYCDDGHLQGTNVAICVEAFRGRGVKRLVAFLKKKGWPVKARVRKSDGMLYLYISGPYGRGLSSQMIRFWKTIAPYVPTCMRQKLPERFQHLADDVYWNTKVQPRAWADEVVEVEPLLRRANVKGRYVGYSRRKHKEGWPQYCLVVEGNHNFLAEGLVVSNCLYDRPVLGCNGFPVGGESDDTLLMHHSAFPGLSHNLQRVGTQFFCITPWKSEFRDSDDTPEALCGYNMKDTLVTARIREPLLSILKRVRGEETYAVDLKMAEAAERMYLAGVPVSREVNERLRVLFSDNMRNARKIIDEKADDPEIRDKLWERLAFEQAQRQRKGDPDDYEARIAVRKDEIATAYAKGKWKWSIGSSDHLAAYLKARGVPMFFRTDKGKTSTKKDILEQYHHVPEVAAIMTYRENQKVFSTFCYKLFDRTNADGELTSYGHVDENDRIHPRWSVHKITGRWGAEDPSCQNWPKADKKKGRPNLRSQVVRPPGRKLVGFDFAQLESRIIALMSGDLWLVTLFADGKDIHSEFARVVWADFDQRPADERKSLRDTVKRAEFGAFYGGAIDTLHKNISKDYPLVKLPDIARMVSMMAENMPGVTRWHNDLLRAIAKPPHEIRSAIYGRRRCFPLGNADMNDVYNFPCQSTGADIMDTGIIRIMPRLDKYDQCWPILNIHDALVFECWEEDAEALKADVIECFTQEHTINGVTVKFPIEADIGDTWAEV